MGRVLVLGCEEEEHSRGLHCGREPGPCLMRTRGNTWQRHPGGLGDKDQWPDLSTRKERAPDLTESCWEGRRKEVGGAEK